MSKNNELKIDINDDDENKETIYDKAKEIVQSPISFTNRKISKQITHAIASTINSLILNIKEEYQLYIIEYAFNNRFDAEQAKDTQKFIFYDELLRSSCEVMSENGSDILEKFVKKKNEGYFRYIKQMKAYDSFIDQNAEHTGRSINYKLQKRKSCCSHCVIL